MTPMGKPILIVDDEQDIRDILADVLEDQGYSVLKAEDGVAALELLEHTEPAVIVLDIIMPRLDGAEVLRRLRAHTEWSKIPVIVSTSDPSRAPLGVKVVPKPVDVDVLLKAVAKAQRSAH